MVLGGRREKKRARSVVPRAAAKESKETGGKSGREKKGPRDSRQVSSRSMFYLAAASGARVKARDPAAPPG